MPGTKGRALFALLAATLLTGPSHAAAAGSLFSKGAALFDEGRLLATGGVSQVEGAGGGGLAVWAPITGYGTRDGIGVDAHLTYLSLPDYALWSPGIAVGLFNRVEISYAHQSFDTEHVGAALGLGKGYTFHQDILGLKARLAGNLVFDQDSWIPELSAGIQFKHNDRGAVIAAVGGHAASGTDFYLAASKLFLAQCLLVNATVRLTKANQMGILGFGGDRNKNYSPEFEGGFAYLLSRRFALGTDVRTKPNNLSIAPEGTAFDLFAAFFISKHFSITAAYANLGNIVIKDHQDGFYLSLQGAL